MKKPYARPSVISGKVQRAIIFAGVFAVLGVAFLLSSHAATPTASYEPEGGTVSSPATTVGDSSASGGSAVKFQVAASGGSCALPNYPDATCTGVPAGTTLTNVPGSATSGTGWSWNAGDKIIEVTSNNAVLSSLNVSGQILVKATGVTVKNTKAYAVLIGNSTAENPSNPRLVVQDSEINCQNTPGSTAIGSKNITVYRLNIHGCENGFDVDSDMTIQDSYIHDLYNNNAIDTHTDGLQSGDGSNMIITHNRWLGSHTGNCGSDCVDSSVLAINNHGTGTTNVLVNNNFLAGAGYTMYCPQGSVSNFRVINNAFSTMFDPKIGFYGGSTDCGHITNGSGNFIYETGAAYTLD